MANLNPGTYNAADHIWITKAGHRYCCRKTDRQGSVPYLAIIEMANGFTSTGLFSSEPRGLAWCQHLILLHKDHKAT